MKRTYTIILEQDTEVGSYAVLVPALPGCQTMGDTIEECIAMARDAIAGHIATLIDLGRPVPEETVHPQAIMLDVTVPQLEVAAGAMAGAEGCG